MGASFDVYPGATLDRYELLAPIAKGGMAQVWAARLRGHGGFSKLVALKMILPELAEDPSFQRMFLDEARIASMIHHPNVCETYDLSETNGTLYIAMEWVDGPSLLRVLRPLKGGPQRATSGQPQRAPIPERIAARIIADACAGLDAAHELVGDDGNPLRVVHRDATPHNILLAADGRVRMSDFGVARAFGQSHSTQAGELKGKVSYMAPEQVTGDALDRRADIFALGACLYECVTGSRAFLGESDAQVISKLLKGEFRRPREVAPAISMELEQIILTAMRHSPAQRFASAEDMRAALDHYLRMGGPPVTSAAVASLVKARCGAEIEERRRIIRSAISQVSTSGLPTDATEEQSQPSAVRRDTMPIPMRPQSAPSFDIVSGSGPSTVLTGEVDLSRPRPKSRTPLLIGALLAATTVAALCTAVFAIEWSRARSANRTAALSASSMTALVPASPLSSASALSSATNAHVASDATHASPAQAATGIAAEGVSPSSAVHFTIKPSRALLVVEGVVLPLGTTSVQRRADGAAQRVLIRADGYNDFVVVVDPATPAELEIDLTQMTRGGGRSGKGSRATAATPASSASADPAPPSNTLPNPYEQ